MPELRLEFLRFVGAEGVTFSEACRRFGISRKTGYKWYRRGNEAAAASGPQAGPLAARPAAQTLQDRSRRPLHSPARTPEHIETAILAVRHRHPAWGGRKISHVLGRDLGIEIAASTVTHVLRRHGLINPAASEAATPWQRYEHDRPNSLWQMDFKGHFPLDGGRCHALTVLDDHSRFNLLLVACGDERGSTVQAALEKAFCLYGLPQRINTDNGTPWGSAGRAELTKLAAWLMRLGIKLSYSTPYHPQTNGKDERFHRTLKAELLQQRFSDLPQTQLAFDRWRHVYNFERPHQALQMQTPSERYSPSARAMPASLPVFDYGPDALIRKVNGSGRISFLNREIRISHALVGEYVSLQPRIDLDGVHDVFYCHQLILTINLLDHPQT